MDDAQIIENFSAIIRERGALTATNYDFLDIPNKPSRREVYRTLGKWSQAIDAVSDSPAAEESAVANPVLFNGRFNIVNLTDWHVPFEDRRAIRAAFDFCYRIQPQVIVLHELHDFYSISKFDKNPNRIIGTRLQDEIDEVTGYLTQLRKLCPESRFILLDSNHLDRLRRFLWSRAPALANLRSLQLESLLDLGHNNVEYMEFFIHQRFLFKHGDLVSKESGMTARRELAREGMSGASGHTHRLGTHYRRNRGGSYLWMECGCLCDLNPEYIRGTADWQHGFGLVSFADEKRKTFFATDLPIIDYEVPL